MELYDSATNLFVYTKPVKLQLEHSLISISKWEEHWRKPYMKPGYRMTKEEADDYIRCMTLNKNVDPEVYSRIPNSIRKEIEDYINDPHTAYPQPKSVPGGGGSHGIVTSEIIYYWMISDNIPISFEKWNLNRLLTLINICNKKNGSGKKMSMDQIRAQNREINAQRRAALHSRG